MALIFFIAFFSTFCIGSMGQSSDTPLIIGGTNAYNGQAPYQVSLRRSNGGHFCGGTIIKSNWIVTARHCTAAATPAYVVVGSVLLNYGGYRYDIATIVDHPKYNSQTVENDISLLKTTTTIIFNSFVQSVSLPIFPIADGATVTITGWGYISYPGSTTPNNLQIINVKTISNTDCIRYWGNKIFSTNLCTLTQAGQGYCMGDSGGPIVANGKLHGIPSWVNPCANGYPDVATRVHKFTPWIILQTMFK